MNYLVKMIEHNTGEVFADVLKIKDNETYKVIEAESREEALEKVKRPKGLLEVIPSSFNNGPISRALSKTYRKSESGRYSPKPEQAPIPPRKDSE